MTVNLPQKPDAAKWAEMSLIDQMANISSEVGRTGKWKRKGNSQLALQAFIRALDLIDLTVAVGRTAASTPAGARDSMLRELLRSRDLFCEEFLSDDANALAPSEKYFSFFAHASAQKSGR
jgi:hypothetical protein